MSRNLQAPLQSLLDILKQIDDSGLSKPASTGRTISKVARYAGIYPVPNLAVSVCEQCYLDVIAQGMQEEKPEPIIRLTGKIAYCTAMPKLCGATNIRDFIACVSYAMLLDIISGPEGTRLLYGAQVAHAALTKRPKKRGKASHTSTAVIDPTNIKSTT